MMKNKLIGGVLLLLAVISTASATGYSANLKVLPGVAFENTDVLISGYLTLSDWGEAVSANELSMRVMESTDIVAEYSFNELTYYNDINNSNILVDGFFYQSIEGLKAGNYTVFISIGSEDIAYTTFQVLDADTNLTINKLGFTEANGPIIEFDYEGANNPETINLYFYGRSNFDNPVMETYADVPNNTEYLVPQRVGFDIDNYVGEDEAYSFIIYAEAGEGSAAQPIVLDRRSGVIEDIYSANLRLRDADVQKGVKDEVLSFDLENDGLLPTTYSLSLSGDLSDYATINDSIVTVAPDEEYEGKILLTIPHGYVPSSGDLTLKAVVNDDEFEDSLNIDLAEPTPVHEVAIESVSFNDDAYFAGDKVIATVTISNEGDFTEDFRAEYHVGEGDVTKRDLSLSPGSSESFDMSFEAVSDSDLMIDLISKNDSFATVTKSFNVNVLSKSYLFNFEVINKSLLVEDELVKEVTLKLENKGNVKDLFLIKTVNYPNVEFIDSGSNSITKLLDAGESVTIKALVNVPVNEESVIVTFSARSQTGSSTKTDNLTMTIFNLESGVEANESLVNMSSSIEDGELIYTASVTNNKLVTKTYNLSYEGNESFVVYPADGLTLSPGETGMIYVYPASSEAGEFELNYTITEDGNELVSQSIKATVPINGLTGFAVAAGSVLGVIGLVVLVVFIYFYFIRQPPKGDDEFKPVEVKKADLGKPMPKNGDKYW